MSVSYWGTELEEDGDASMGANFDMDDSFLGTFVDGPRNFETFSEVEASSIDIEYARDHQFSDDWSITTLFGVRMVEFEEEYGIVALGSGQTLDDMFTQDTDAFGAKVGLHTTYQFTDLFSVSGGANFSFVSGDTEQAIIERTDDSRFLEQDISGMIVDLRLAAGFDLGEWIDLEVFLGHSSWSDVAARRLTTGDDVDDGSLFVSRDTVSFDSIGLAVTIGG